MRCNAAGILLIKKFESLRLEAYPDPVKGERLWTIGYGHTEGVKKGQRITEHQANAILDVDLDLRERKVAALTHGLDLNENEFSALVSFVFNLGAASLARSQLLKKLWRKDKAGAAEEFGKWVYGDGKVVPGLVRRRAAERELFLLKPPATVAA